MRILHIFGKLIVLWVILLWGCTPRSALKAPEAKGARGAEPVIRVGLADETGLPPRLLLKGNYTLTLEEAIYHLDESVGEFEVLNQEPFLVLRSKRRYFSLPNFQHLVFKPADAGQTFQWNGTLYQGELVVHYMNGEIVAVNVLPVETYLLGVVPHEIPSNTTDYKEAVYAQAIAARSYALYRIGNPVNTLFDLWSDERDQVYKGIAKIPEIAQKAVNDTRGVALTKNSQPTVAFYHASSGGILEGEKMGEDGTVMPIYDRLDGEFNDKAAPDYRWREYRRAEVILNHLAREFALDPNLVQSWIDNGFQMTLEINERSPSGRVQRMTIQVDDRKFPISRDQVRRILADESGKALPSSLFFLVPIPDRENEFYIYGAGKGHGRGMSQWGAIGLAMKGQTYRRILSFYYPDLEITKIY